jgi:hypothetical protein
MPRNVNNLAHGAHLKLNIGRARNLHRDFDVVQGRRSKAWSFNGNLVQRGWQLRYGEISFIAGNGLTTIVGLNVRDSHFRLRDNRTCRICYPSGNSTTIALSPNR